MVYYWMYSAHPRMYLGATPEIAPAMGNVGLAPRSPMYDRRKALGKPTAYK